MNTEQRPGYCVSEIVDGYDGEDFKGLPEKEAKAVDAIVGAMGATPRYFLTPESYRLVVNTDLEGGIFDGFRLPFPAMTLEIDVGKSDERELEKQKAANEVDCRYRVVFVYDGGQSLRFVTWSKVMNPMVGRELWILSPVAISIPYDLLSKVDEWAVSKHDEHGAYAGFEMRADVLPQLVGESPFPSYFMQILKFAGTRGEDPKSVAINLSRDTLPDIITALKLFMVLSAHGVETEVVETPAWVNKKRRKHKKLPPIPAYRTLCLRGSAGHGTGLSGGGGGGARRLHWRRGHLRWQAHGPQWSLRRRIWVRPMVVGRAGGDAPPPVPQVKLTA